MEFTTLDPVGRFHRALVEEILRSRPSYLSEPFTVAEIYQNLVPYRTHRDRIGVEMNGDYEDALLRLLAGEGEYLMLESEHAVREIREELGSSNPNTGLYRAYAAADVRLNPLRMPRDLPDPVSAPAVGQASVPAPPAPVPDPIPTPERVRTADVDPAPATHSVHAAAPQPPVEPTMPEQPSKPAAPSSNAGTAHPQARGKGAGSAPGGPPSACVWCREPLPRRDVLNFCPFCGADTHTAPCSNCGEELEIEWRFCVACGTTVGERG